MLQGFWSASVKHRGEGLGSPFGLPVVPPEPSVLLVPELHAPRKSARQALVIDDRTMLMA